MSRLSHIRLSAWGPAVLTFLVGACNYDWGRPLYRADSSITDGLTPDTSKTDATAVTQRAWIRVSAGSFTMGSPPDEACRDSNEVEHTVSLTRCFDIMRAEVDREAFKKRMGYLPLSDDGCIGDGCPVRHIGWHEAAAYCNALSANDQLPPCYTCNAKTGEELSCQSASEGDIRDCPGYRLPTEAEWEYACRAGTTTSLHNGALTSCDAADGRADQIAWYRHNSAGVSHPGAGLSPNSWGLHDMAGNVLEWCHDWYTTDLGQSDVTDPSGPEQGVTRVIRGGSFNSEAGQLRGAARKGLTPNVRTPQTGVRCVRTSPVLIQGVVSRVMVPKKTTDYAIDHDGSGPKNQLGTVFGSLQPLIDLEAEFNRELESGDRVLVFELYGNSLASDGDARVQVHAGRDLDSYDEDNFTGFEPFALHPVSPPNAVLPATVSHGRVRAGPATVKLSMPLLGPMLMEYRMARVLGTVVPGGVKDGVIAGVISQAELDSVLIPSIARALTDIVNPKSSKLSEQEKQAIKQMFDADQDGVITAAEVKKSALAALLAPDIDTDNDGKKDGYSVGLGFEGVTCVLRRDVKRP